MKLKPGSAVTTVDGITVIPIVDDLFFCDENGTRVTCAGISEVKAVAIVTPQGTVCFDIEGVPVEPASYGIDIEAVVTAIERRADE